MNKIIALLTLSVGLGVYANTPEKSIVRSPNTQELKTITRSTYSSPTAQANVQNAFKNRAISAWDNLYRTIHIQRSFYPSLDVREIKQQIFIVKDDLLSCDVDTQIMIKDQARVVMRSLSDLRRPTAQDRELYSCLEQEFSVPSVPQTGARLGRSTPINPHAHDLYEEQVIPVERRLNFGELAVVVEDIHAGSKDESDTTQELREPELFVSDTDVSESSFISDNDESQTYLIEDADQQEVVIKRSPSLSPVNNVQSTSIGQGRIFFCVASFAILLGYKDFMSDQTSDVSSDMQSIAK